MFAGCIDVQSGGYLVLSQRLVEHEAVFDGNHDIRGGMDKKSRWGVGVDMLLV